MNMFLKDIQIVPTPKFTRSVAVALLVPNTHCIKLALCCIPNTIPYRVQ